MSLEEQFVSYVKGKTGLSRLFDTWVKRYETMEHLGGSVQLDNLSDTEKDTIGLFLGTHITSSQIRISYVKMQKALDTSKYADCNFIDILRLYKGKDFHFKKSEIQKEEDAFSSFCATMMEQNIGKSVHPWLIHITQNTNPVLSKWKELWKTNIDDTLIIVNAINHLPVWDDEIKQIAVYAQEMSKDPHYFDSGITQYLLLHAIYDIFQIEEPQSTLERAEALLKAGLLRDDISNFCMITHLRGFQGETEHKAWQEFYDIYEPWMVNVYNLQKITRITADKSVFIVENPSTFRMLSMFINKNRLPFGIICTYGQPNLCVYLLLDLLYETDCEMYYGGDFDPEGIMMADNLKQRYPKLKLWHFTYQDYLHSMSNKLLDERRLKKLDKCKDSDLWELRSYLRKNRYAGYQESLHEQYRKDLSCMK